MRNFKDTIEAIKSSNNDYKRISNESHDDQYFAEKYGEIGITSRKDFFIWKDNITAMASPEEIKKLESKYHIKF